MDQYNTYGEFLNQSYRKILEACLSDQAIDTLKILQNKDYLLIRINQLFSEIYVAEREKVIQDQATIISSLQQGQRTTKSIENFDKCFSCQLMKEHITQMEHQISEFEKKVSHNESTEEKSVKKIESMLLKEMQELKKQVKNLQEQSILKKIEYQEQITKIRQQNIRFKTLLNQESERNEKRSQKQIQRLKQIEEQKQGLENQLFNYIESKGKQEKDIRELNAKCMNLNITKQKFQGEVTLLRNENNILEEKLKHLEEDNLYLKQKVSLTEKEVKGLKKQLQKTAESEKINTRKLEQNIQSSKVQDLADSQDIHKKSSLLRKNIELQKQIQSLKQQLSEKQLQFGQTKVQNEKIILKLSDQLRKFQIKAEKDLRAHKDEYKKSIEKSKEDIQSEWKEQKQELIKKYERILSQKNDLSERLQEKIIALNRNLIEYEQSATQTLKQFESERNRLQRQLQQQKYNYNELKRYYDSQKISQSALEKENLDKYQQILLEKREMEKIMALKEKEIREYKKQILRNTELVNSLQIKVDDLKNKNHVTNETIDEQRSKLKSLSQKLKEKNRECRDLQQRYAQLLGQKQEADKKIASITINQRRLEEKVRKYETELAQKRETLLTMHQTNQQQVIDVFAKAQQTTVETRKQLQNYYLNLLKANEEKTTNTTIYQLEKMQEEQLQKLRSKNMDYEQRMKKIKAKCSQQQKQRLNNESKIYALIQQNQQLKSQNGKALDLIHEQKKKNLNIIKAYQDKMLQYYNNFSQFKRQFYLSLKQELSLVKNQLYQLGDFVMQQKVRYQQYMIEYGEKINRQIEIMNHNHRLQIEKIKHQYEYERILKIQEEKREIKMQCDMKMKQQSIQFYTIMAQKQHEIKTFTQRQAKINKKLNDLEIKNQQLQKTSKQTIKKNEQFKQIINKMNNKVTDSERTTFSLQNELEFYKKSNMELKKQINQLETNFKEKIQECREKYSAENERLFAKYQKQFSKFIVSNKKSLQFSMLSNSCNNIHVPTKGAPTEGMLDKIQKQIQEQKKKLNVLERGIQSSKGKFDKTSKMAGQRDNHRLQKFNRY